MEDSQSRRQARRALPARGVDAVLIVGVATLVMLPSLLLGPPRGHDYYHHRAWISAFTEQLSLTEPYPRWLEGLWHGAGAADFFFYPPMPYWLAGALERLACRGCGPDGLMVGVGLVTLALSGLGFWRLARRFAGRWPAVAAAAVYVALPFHLGADWYDRLALAEFTAIAVLPWHLAAFLDCLENRGGWLRLALLSGILVFSHLPTVVMVAVAYGVLTPCLAWRSGWRPVAVAVAAGALGLGLAAVYWYPAVSLLGSVSPDLLGGEEITRKHFLVPPSAIQGGFVEWLRPPFVTLSVVTGLILLLCRRSAAAPIALVLLLLTWFMVAPVSMPVWTETPVARLQYPWRFLVLSDLAFALAAMMAVETLSSRRELAGRRIFAGLALGTIALVAGLRHPGLDQPDAYAVVEDGRPRPPQNMGAPEWLPKGTLGRGTGMTYLEYVRLGEEAQAQSDRPAITLEGDGRVEVTGTALRRIAFEVDLPAPARMIAHRTYWRYWRLENAATGEPIALAPTHGFPLVSATLPAGRAAYVLELPRLAAERTGAAISALSLAVLLAAWLLSRRRRRS